ncbi:MAG TPA: hypothetical protein VMW76_05825 [Bacteroidales bacterium]|nr:hypothetical protein [Bacteroidales bacterium]
MKKTISMIIIIASCLCTANAQKQRDALYLKNGSVIYGDLVEVSNATYKIMTSDGSLFVYTEDEIDRYQKADNQVSGFKESNLGVGMEAGFLIGSQSSSYIAPFSFSSFLVYRLGAFQSIAAGSGVEFLGVSFMPLFLEYKYHLANKPVSPYIFGRAGFLAHLGGTENDNPHDYYSSYDEREYKGGPSFAVGTGIAWCKESYGMNLSFAFRYARTSCTYNDYYSSPTTYETNWRRLEVKFGFEF